MVIWSFATSMGPIMLFSIIYGFAGSWFLSLIPPVVAQMFGTEGFATLVGFVVLTNSPGRLSPLLLKNTFARANCGPLYVNGM